jgi:SP family myo-inositol transporter-like MFS transporter 13
MTSFDEKRSSTQQHPLGKGYDAMGSNLNDLDNIVHDIDTGEINELVVVAEGEERTTWFVWILVLCSTISGLLFGGFSFISHLGRL